MIQPLYLVRYLRTSIPSRFMVNIQSELYLLHGRQKYRQVTRWSKVAKEYTQHTENARWGCGCAAQKRGVIQGPVGVASKSLNQLLVFRNAS